MSVEAPQPISSQRSSSAKAQRTEVKKSHLKDQSQDEAHQTTSELSNGKISTKRKRDEDTTQSTKSKVQKQRHASDTRPKSNLGTSSDLSKSVHHSPFYVHTISLYLPLSPVVQLNPLKGICTEHLSPMLLKYNAELEAVILSYSNVRLGDNPFGEVGSAKVFNEAAAWYIWATVDFILFKPQSGDLIEGAVSVQTEEHVSMICWNLFNANVDKQRLRRDWTWREPSDITANGELPDTASWEDINGKSIEGKIQFQIKDVEATGEKGKGFLSLEGTLLDELDEAALLKEEEASWKKSHNRA